MILNSSLRENLLYGADEASNDDELINLIDEFKLFNEDNLISLEKHISNKMLSTGQMQKISFIRSLLAKSDILLLDESTSNLDVQSKKLIFEILKQRNLTIVNATHNPDEFLNFDRQIKIEIKDGKRIILD